MGYLDNSTVTVDAILTNKGRQILAAGGRLDITKFALSDDEIDYSLWNPSHTLGSNYYGAVIEAMPVLEANPDESQMMRYKLVTLPKTVSGIPVITVTPSVVSLQNMTSQVTVTPVTSNVGTALNATLGYTAILSDSTIADLMVAPDGVVAGGIVAEGATTANFLDDNINTGVTTSTGATKTVVGTKFIVKPKQTETSKTALLTIIANETGGFKTITVSVSANWPMQTIFGEGGK